MISLRSPENQRRIFRGAAELRRETAPEFLPQFLHGETVGISKDLIEGGLIGHHSSGDSHLRAVRGACAASGEHIANEQMPVAISNTAKDSATGGRIPVVENRRSPFWWRS